jgi:hypothetical protein
MKAFPMAHLLIDFNLGKKTALDRKQHFPSPDPGPSRLRES